MENVLSKVRGYWQAGVRRFGWWKLLTIILAVVVVISLSPSLIRGVIDYSIPLEQLSSMAVRSKQAGDNKTALRLYHTISARASKSDFSSNYEIGNIYAEMGRWKLAEKYYLKAASNPAALSSVFYQLSDLYLKHLPNKKDSFAELLTYRAQNDRKADAGLMIILASFYRELGKNDLALQWFKQVVILEPDNTSAQAAVAELEAML